MYLTPEDFSFLAGMEELKEDFALAHELAESVRAGKPKVWDRKRKYNGYGRTDETRRESLELIIKRNEGRYHKRKVTGKKRPRIIK